MKIEQTNAKLSSEEQHKAIVNNCTNLDKYVESKID